jgi:hypothetical protein
MPLARPPLLNFLQSRWMAQFDLPEETFLIIGMSQ